MKKQAIFISALSIFALFSCNNADNTDTTTTMDSTASMTTTATTPNASDDMAMSTYYSLDSKQPVKIMEDENTHQYVDESTHKPLSYYYDPMTRDTFDSKGRLINNALVLTDGNYTLDEAKVKSNDNAFKIKYDDYKMKIQHDGDMKMKSEDVKIKDKGDKYKEITDSTKLKIKDGEVKMKKR